VACSGDGSLVVGRSHPGRGAWLCRDSPACLELAVKRKAFDRALRTQTGDFQVERLRAALRSPPGENAGPGSEGPVP